MSYSRIALALAAALAMLLFASACGESDPEPSFEDVEAFTEEFLEDNEDACEDPEWVDRDDLDNPADYGDPEEEQLLHCSEDTEIEDVAYLVYEDAEEAEEAAADPEQASTLEGDSLVNGEVRVVADFVDGEVREDYIDELEEECDCGEVIEVEVDEEADTETEEPTTTETPAPTAEGPPSFEEVEAFTSEFVDANQGTCDDPVWVSPEDLGSSADYGDTVEEVRLRCSPDLTIEDVTYAVYASPEEAEDAATDPSTQSTLDGPSLVSGEIRVVADFVGEARDDYIEQLQEECGCGEIMGGGQS